MIESLRTSMSQLNPFMGGGGDDGTEHEGGWLIYAHTAMGLFEVGRLGFVFVETVNAGP